MSVATPFDQRVTQAALRALGAGAGGGLRRLLPFVGPAVLASVA